MADSLIAPYAALHVSVPLEGTCIKNGTYVVAYLARELDQIFLQPVVLENKVKERRGRLRRDESAVQPQEHSLRELKELEARGLITSATVSVPALLTRPARTEYAKNHFKMWMEILSWLTSNERLYEMLVRQRYSEVLESAAARFNIDTTALRRGLARYFSLGGDIHAASMPKHGVEKARKPAKEKLGRRPKNWLNNPESLGSNATEQAKEAVEVFMKTCRKTKRSGRDKEDGSKKFSLAAMHRLYRDTYVLVPTGVDEHGRPIIQCNQQYELTYRQFVYIWQQHVSALEAAKYAAGGRRWKKDLRVLTSHARAKDHYSGSTYLIDATVGDIHLVSAIDRKVRVGRPIIYVVLDVFSYAILALHVSLEAPSADQARIALYKAMTPKDLCVKELGLPDEVIDGLLQGIRSAHVFADRGELLSQSIRDLATDTGTVMSYAAPYRAEWKALVERYFGILNDLALHDAPGGTTGRLKERGEHDARLDACLTIADLTRLLLCVVAEWNLTHDCSRFAPLSLHGRAKPYPASLYEVGAEELHGSPYRLTRADAIRDYLPTIKARATRQGLVVNDLRFTADWMESSSWYYMQRSRKREVDIYLDPDRPDTCYVHTDGNELREAKLVDVKQALLEDATLHEFIEYIVATSQPAAKDSRDTEVVGRGLRFYQQKVIEHSGARSSVAQANDDRSDTAKVADIKVSRRNEKDHDKGHRPVEKVTATDTPGVANNDEVDEMAAILKAISP